MIMLTFLVYVMVFIMLKKNSSYLFFAFVTFKGFEKVRGLTTKYVNLVCAKSTWSVYIPTNVQSDVEPDKTTCM